MDLKDALFDLLAGLAAVDGKFTIQEQKGLSDYLRKIYGIDILVAIEEHKKRVENLKTSSCQEFCVRISFFLSSCINQ